LKLVIGTSHNHAKSQPEILFYFVIKKMKKSNMFGRFENDYTDLNFCYLSVAQNIKYLKLIFTCLWDTSLTIRRFVVIIFKNLKIEFFIF
jgi:hypothetical protein